jgi:predicted metal-binding membrane protein
MDRATAATAANRRPDASSLTIPGVLLVFAAAGWWWSARMTGEMRGMAEPMSDMGDAMHGMGMMATAHALSFGAFLLAWLAMMTAMMFPAISPVVKLYSRGAAAGRVAPLPFFVAGYIAVWTSLGIPAFFAWRALMEPIAMGETWAAYLAGGVLVAAAIWQLTPLKTICLRHCRSPMSVFLRFGAKAERPSGAARMGATHGAYCLGCCWALMAVLVALGTMNIVWMVALAAMIFVEKNAPGGEVIARVGSAAFVALALLLFIRPDTLMSLT